MQTEQWRIIPRFPDYEVSSLGRVRRRTDGRGKARAGRILRLYRTRGGYLGVRLAPGAKHRSAHSLVMEAFLGPRPEGLQVNHKNGARDDNRLENLEYVTPKENCRHAVRVLGSDFGSGARGEDNANAKLSERDVRVIRALAREGYPAYLIARHYKVSRPTIHAVITRKTWAHV